MQQEFKCNTRVQNFYCDKSEIPRVRTLCTPNRKNARPVVKKVPARTSRRSRRREATDIDRALWVTKKVRRQNLGETDKLSDITWNKKEEIDSLKRGGKISLPRWDNIRWEWCAVHANKMGRTDDGAGKKGSSCSTKRCASGGGIGSHQYWRDKLTAENARVLGDESMRHMKAQVGYK